MRKAVLASPTEAATYVKRAAEALDDCASLPRAKRIEALQWIAEAIDAEKSKFANSIVQESKKPINQARSEVQRASNTFALAAKLCSEFVGEEFHFDQVPSGIGRRGWWSRRPIGIVVGVTPFNDPLNLMAHKVAPALAVGAPVIVKPHPIAKGTAEMLTDLCVQADLPENMVQCANLSDSGTLALGSHEKVAVVSFTGGTNAASQLARASAGKKLQMELGGVGISMVDQSANLDRAAQCLVSGITSAAGQNCIHTQRIIAHKDIFDGLCRRLKERMSTLSVGDPYDSTTDVGPLIDRETAQKVRHEIGDAVARGSIVVAGGGGSDCFVQPTLLSHLPKNHPLLEEEQFAPVATIDRTDSISRSIKQLSNTSNMINFSIFSNKLDQILLAQSKVNAGTIIVNDSTDFRIDAMPFGGNGTAGLGREGVRFAMEAMTAPRLFCLRA